MKTELQAFCDQALTALFNGGYQGILLAGCIFLLFKALPGLNAATRHAVSFVSLIIIFLLPFAHFVDAALRKQIAIHEPAALTRNLAPISFPEKLHTRESPQTPLEFEESLALTVTQPLAEDTVLLSAIDAAALAPEISVDIPDSAEVSIGALSPLSEPEPKPSLLSRLPSLSFTREFSLPAKVSLTIGAMLICLASIRMAMLVSQFFLLRSLKRSALPPNHDLAERFENLRLESCLNRSAILLISEQAPSPMAIGFCRPAVLLSARVLEESSAIGLDQIIRHELAHLSRHDDWINLLQQIIAALFFFHPGVWWLSRRLTVDREIACDDYVLAMSGKPRSYALLLAEFASRAQSRPELTAVPAAWSKKSQLKERITMILDPKRNSSPRLARTKAGVLSAAALCTALFAMQAAPRVALAQATATSPDAPRSEEPAVSVTTETTTETTIDAQVDLDGLSVATVVAAGADELPDAEERPVPRVKSAPHPAPKPVPAPALAPVQPIQPNTPHPPVAVLAAPAPRHPDRAPRAARAVVARTADENLEKRLERLERMVEELLNQKPHPTPPDFHGKQKWPLIDGKIQFNQEEIQRIQKDAQLSAEQANKEAEKAMREMQKSMEKMSKDKPHGFEKMHQEFSWQHSEFGRKEGEAQRKALEARRKMLEENLRAVERELERFERNQDRLEAELEAEAEKEHSKPKRRESGDDSDTPSLQKR